MLVSDLLAPKAFLGVGLILRQPGGFLFGIRPPKQHSSQIILEITGIGGKMEAGDASLAHCARREAYEEISAAIRILPCPHALVVRSLDQVQEVTFEGIDRPAALVFRGHRTPPHQPFISVQPDDGCVVVFLAELIDSPTPSPEIPYLIQLSPSQIFSAAQADLPISDLLKGGGLLLPGPFPPPDPAALARLTDSQEALALALGRRAESFYLSLFVL